MFTMNPTVHDLPAWIKVMISLALDGVAPKPGGTAEGALTVIGASELAAGDPAIGAECGVSTVPNPLSSNRGGGQSQKARQDKPAAKEHGLSFPIVSLAEG